MCVCMLVCVCVHAHLCMWMRSIHPLRTDVCYLSPPVSICSSPRKLSGLSCCCPALSAHAYGTKPSSTNPALSLLLFCIPPLVLPLGLSGGSHVSPPALRGLIRPPLLLPPLLSLRGHIKEVTQEPCGTGSLSAS